MRILLTFFLISLACSISYGLDKFGLELIRPSQWYNCIISSNEAFTINELESRRAGKKFVIIYYKNDQMADVKAIEALETETTVEFTESSLESLKDNQNSYKVVFSRSDPKKHPVFFRTSLGQERKVTCINP